LLTDDAISILKSYGSFERLLPYFYIANFIKFPQFENKLAKISSKSKIKFSPRPSLGLPAPYFALIF